MRRASSTIPYGYKLAQDSVHLEPVPEELEALEEVTDAVSKGFYSLREGSDILYALTGRSITHTGLRNILEKRRLGA